MVGVPVIINHKDITAKNANDERVGVVSNVWFDDKDGWYWCDGVIWDETAQNLITDKGWSVSCSYDVKLADDAGGTENNIPYDIEFLDGVFTHLAIVDNPRYERANIVFNSKTVVKNNADFEAKHPRDEQGRFTDIPSDSNGYSIKEFVLNGREIMAQDNLEDFNPMIKNNVQNWNEADHPRDEAGKFTEKWERVRKTQENYGRKVKLKDGHKTGIILGSVPRGDNPDSGEEMYQYEIKWDDGKIERLHSNKVDLITDLKELEKEIEDNPQGWMTPRNLERIKKQKSLQETKGWTQKEIKDFYSSSIAGDDYAKKWEYAKAHPWRDLTITNNNKEQDMALLDELKKLITKVENDKGENMDDNKEKIENEKVDKRDIIRQIMAIAGKHEDNEDVRTIAKLAEKLAYDKSEAGTADNEKEDEPKDDKPADNKKVKNEETKEDEKKYDDLKKEVKEDVENKCKNSVDNSKGGYFDKMNEIYNAATQPTEENTYISREQKLKNAEEYFAK